MSILIGSPQLEKIYDPTNEEDDMVEMEEERLRMREHVMNEVCVCVCVCVCAIALRIGTLIHKYTPAIS